MKVILVRHAQTEWNQHGVIQGHKDSPLTARGTLETAALLTAFTDAAYPVECVFTSPLGRAWKMGQALAGHFQCPLVIEEALKEQSFGQYEGMTKAQLEQEYRSQFLALFSQNAAFCPPGGESLAHASQRIIHFLREKMATTTHQTFCVVTHGHVMQGMLALLKEGNTDHFNRYAQPNASYTVLEVSRGLDITLRWGISTHLLKLASEG
ncbi:histidine phosphatase family protein [Enterobacter mori]|uniref:histidine phosphatase family protein n=1 Tax=Enterobacter mori TaxID=539813 RepID=UPI002235DAE8|nr:histidine phosphatase family protein [Enterobacter mori]MCW4990140.1 histidine phosphatase family protein [Enterobacter mori]